MLDQVRNPEDRFSHNEAQLCLEDTHLNQPGEVIILMDSVKFLNFWTPENFAIIYLKFKQWSQIIGYFVKKMQMELQTV